jgi:maltose alpha-D-glucosyltransferase/alpha-amylase
MVRTLRESPEVGAGDCTALDRDFPPGVLVHRADAYSGSMLFLHNLDEQDVTLDLGYLYPEADNPNEVFGDHDYPPVGGLDNLELGPFGYRWIRLHRNPRG